MKFLTLGEKTNPAILALNGTLCSGEGLAPLWQRLAGEYYIILPTYDGCDGSKSVYQGETEQAKKFWPGSRKTASLRWKWATVLPWAAKCSWLLPCWRKKSVTR